MRSIRIASFMALTLTFLSCGGDRSSTSTPNAPSVVPPEGFMVAVLPDTQCYVSAGAAYAPGSCGGNPVANIDMMQAQTGWIVSHRDTLKVAAVIGLGDIVQSGGRSAEWQAADSAYQPLDNHDIPYIAAVGNHDYDTAGGSIGSRLTVNYNRTLGRARFVQRAWAGTSTYPTGANDNSYITFDVGTDKFLVVSLELFPRTAALDWASGVISSNADRSVIVVTHSYLGPDGSRSPSQWNPAPSSFGLTDGNDGDAIWTNLVSKHANIIAVVNGHVAPLSGSTAAARRVDPGAYGNRVAQMVSNFQYSPGGGNGYLRLLNIQPAKHKIIVQTYSPYLDRWLTDDPNSYAIEYGTN